MKSDQRTCPFCKQKNACMAQSEQACWCNNVTIAKELIDLIPGVEKNKCCICRNCIESFNNDPATFKKRRHLSINL